MNANKYAEIPVGDEQEAKPRVSRKRVPYVKIEVLGGVAEITKKTKGCIVELIDHDNGDTEPQRLAENDRRG